MTILVVNEDEIKASDELVNELRRSIVSILVEMGSKVPKKVYLDNFEDIFEEYKESRKKLIKKAIARGLRKASPEDISSKYGGTISLVVKTDAAINDVSSHRLSELIGAAARASMGYTRSGHVDQEVMVDAFNWRTPVSFKVKVAGAFTMPGDDLAPMKKKADRLVERLYPSKDYSGNAADVILSVFPTSTNKEEIKEVKNLKDAIGSMIKTWSKKSEEFHVGEIKAVFTIRCSKEISKEKKWHKDEKSHASMIQDNVWSETRRKVDSLGWVDTYVSVEVDSI
jgi:hypothetical protein